MQEIQFTEAQEAAMASCVQWYNNWKEQQEAVSQVFHIFGYAGTGKTTLTKTTVAQLKAYALYAAFTGKAALVMTRHGTPASTFHHYIYKPEDIDKARIDQLYQQLKKSENTDEKVALRAEIEELEKPRFSLRHDSELAEADLLVLDEVSMLNEQHYNDALHFGKPIIVLGDPGQLPPIEGTGAFIVDNPEVMLKEIHRQALDNPIIQLATRARNQLPIPLGEFGESRHIEKPRKDIEMFELMRAHNQVLVGKNKTRRELNALYRQAVGFPSVYPVIGDRLICLRNDQKQGLTNGLMAEVLELGDVFDYGMDVRIMTEDNPEPKWTRMLKGHFEEYQFPGTVKDIRWFHKQGLSEFDYGYAITVHKSQGSQWEDVMLVDDKMLVWKKQDRARWLYTAITRAANRLTICS